ncbi:hypothetical protein EAH78_09530 [Pseudomonas arsenicoxydans]|uniref:Uncharacterized protein n=1 Tax=Pseudomonas arsenicoxydans TaxID=702115 RepID=A0A502I0L5_9PSED|nr:hypothetical protein EAH78_09530 [Pseudomonas arsenicoxydans]
MAAEHALWRGSLLPLGREAAPELSKTLHSSDFTAAAQPSGSKLPRHTFAFSICKHPSAQDWRGSCIPWPFAGFPSPASGG